MQLCFILKPKRYPKWHSNRSGSPSRICACARKPKTKKKRDFSLPRGPKPNTKNQKKRKTSQNCCFFRYKKKQHISVCIFCDFWTLPGGPGLQKSSKIIVGSFKIDGPTVCQKNLKLVENTTKMMPKRESRNSRNSRRMQKDSIGSRSKFHWFSWDPGAEARHPVPLDGEANLLVLGPTNYSRTLDNIQ